MAMCHACLYACTCVHRKQAFTFSSDEEEEVRVVQSQKDKRWEDVLSYTEIHSKPFPCVCARTHYMLSHCLLHIQMVHNIMSTLVPVVDMFAVRPLLSVAAVYAALFVIVISYLLYGKWLVLLCVSAGLRNWGHTLRPSRIAPRSGMCLECLKVHISVKCCSSPKVVQRVVLLVLRRCVGTIVCTQLARTSGGIVCPLFACLRKLALLK